MFFVVSKPPNLFLAEKLSVRNKLYMDFDSFLAKQTKIQIKVKTFHLSSSENVEECFCWSKSFTIAQRIILNQTQSQISRRFELDLFMNLHIFAEEDAQRPEDHTIGGFDKIASIFDFQSAPRLLSVSNIPPVTKGPRIRGTTPIEFTSLALRTRELGYLGRDVREQLLNGTGPATIRVSSVGGDPITCLPLGSQ